MALVLAGCQTTEKKRSAHVPAADSIAMRPKIDVRTIRTTLVGKSMREVVEALGQPTTAYTIDERETWSYEDRARDSITGRPVHFVEIIFKKRIVQNVDFSF